MLTISDLPLLNASLNGMAAILLAIGYVSIRRGHVQRHHRLMVAAFVTSALFLVSYLIYHAHAGSKVFPGQGPIRALYFLILATHIVLAAVILPLSITTLWRGWTAQIVRHRRIARWTLPIWIYVSITGVVIYLMLYKLY